MRGCVSYEDYAPDDGMNQVKMTGVFLPLIFWCLKMGENGGSVRPRRVGFHTDVKTPSTRSLFHPPILDIHDTASNVRIFPFIDRFVPSDASDPDVVCSSGVGADLLLKLFDGRNYQRIQ